MTLDPLTFALEIVNFLVLLWLLSHFLYKPIQQAIARRQQTLQHELVSAREQQQQAATLAHQYQQKLDDWQQEQTQRQLDLQHQLTQTREDALADVRADASAEQQRLTSLQQQDRDQREQQLQRQAITDALHLCQHLLQRLNGPELDQALLNLLIEDLQQLPEETLADLRNALTNNHNRMTVYSASALSDQSRTLLLDALEQVLGLAPECDFTDEPTLIGGLRLTIGARVLHANLQDELDFFRQSLSHSQQNHTHMSRTHE